MNKRSFKSRLAAALCPFLLMGALASCAPKNQASVPGGTPAPTQAVVRTAINAEPDSLDPFIYAAADTEAIMLNVYEGLLGFNAKGELVPGLAQKWTVSPDGLTYTFQLREGVLFHDGAPLRPEDVVWTYQKYAGIGFEKPIRSKMANIASIKADPSGITIVLKKSDTSFLTAMLSPVVRKQAVDLAQKPNGTGPFQFVSYNPSQKVVLKKHSGYWNKERMPRIDSCEFRIMTDPSSILLALKSGELDFAGVDAINAAGIKSEFDVVSVPQNMVQLLALNNSRAPFDSVKVRQAMNYAINKDEIIQSVALQYGTKLESNFSPAMAHYFAQGLDRYKPDLPKAKELLKEAGYPEGFTTTVTVPSNYKFHVDTAQVLQNQLAKAGIRLEIKQVEWGQWLDKVYSKAEYDSTIIGFTGKLDPNEVLGRYASTWPKNFIKFNNPAFDAGVKKGIELPDGPERVAIYKQLQKILVEEAASVYIMDPNLVLAFKKNLKGFTNYPVRFLDMSALYFEP
ncbi:Dipeptide-binding ABC transporter, periplasmic substrate-binding component [Clostridiaceae bacterium JG1575]|nr:Dipeptide-binding ABC transporter, periplasmic substrate-binding component [Clostridiaceae bacterium JG1575]